MSSSFFLKKGPKTNKRKLQRAPGQSKYQSTKGDLVASKRKRPQVDEEEISSDDSDESEQNRPSKVSNLTFSSDENEEENPQDKRIRLAKQYLEEIAKEEAERAEDRQLHDHVADRLQTEYLDSVGRLRKNIAASITGYEESSIVKLKNKRQHLPVCSIVVSTDGRYIFSGAKTQYVLKWDLETKKLEGYFDVSKYKEDIRKDIKRRSNVITMCLSTDMKFLAVSDGGNNIQIWCPKELKHIKTFKGHRDVVTALVFRKDTHDLYSGSKDRSVKIWSLDEMGYVESLFGHQANITSIDALSRERAITSGGTDYSLRIWKITEESQLIYNAPRSSIEHVKFINDENFISTSEDGSLCLWSGLKKKPIFIVPNVHGLQTNEDANWITAIANIVNTDLIATGSFDGYIRLWQATENVRKLKEILKIPVTGFVNSLAFNADGTKLYAGIGQEHRLGRWWRIKESKNQILIINLIRSSTNTTS